MADPEAPTRPIRSCIRTGAVSPRRGRVAHVRLLRHASNHLPGASRATGAALDARSDDHQPVIHVLREVSLRLLRGTPPAPSDDTRDMFRAAELALVELGARLSGLVGADGYRALVARAVQRAASEFPVLQSVKPGTAPPGRLVGLPAPDSRHATATEARNAAVALLAELLWLLDEFIGRDLTQRVVVLVWPWLGETGISRDAESQRLTG